MTNSARLPDASEIARALDRRVEQLVRELLPAGKRNGQYWSVGSVDNDPGASLYIHLSGAKIGRWADAATGEFGDALDLVAQCRFRGDKKQAWQWACAWLGFGEGVSPAQTNKPTPAARAAAPDDDAERRRRAALRLYLEAQPSLAGTPVAEYLAGRGIDLAQLGRQPRSLRYHPSLRHAPSGRSFPAMIAAISGVAGAHAATHRTWLQQDQQGRWIKARVEKPKMVLGDFAGGSIRIWRGASGKPLRDAVADETIVIGEGIETCLSIALACPEYRVLAAVSLGAMGSIALPPQIRSIILAIDNDTHPKAQRARQRVIEQHMDAGRDVRVARSAIGNDMNDGLLAFGEVA
jgi:Toprim domain